MHNRNPCHHCRPAPCRAGTQSACLSQGAFEAAGRRYVVVWKMVNEVLILSLTPAGHGILTAQRLNGAVAQLLLLYCKSTAAVTMDKIFRKYVQVRRSLAGCVPSIAHSRCAARCAPWRGLAQMGTSLLLSGTDKCPLRRFLR